MDKEALQQLREYAFATETRIHALSQTLPEAATSLYGLDRSKPLNIWFGVEDEHLLFQANKIVSDDKSGSKICKLAERFDKALSKKASRFLYETEDDYGVEYEGEKLETRLKRGGMRQTFHNASGLTKAFFSLLENFNLKAIFGLTRHVHIQLRQRGKSLISRDIYNFDNPLSFHTACGILRIQQEALALFVEPARIEDKKASKHISVKKLKMPTRWGIDNRSIMVKRPDGRTLEARLGASHVEMSLALYASAIEWALTTMSKPFTGQQPAGKFPNFDGKKIKHKKGAFMKMLEKTMRSDFLRELFPPELVDAMILDAVDRYAEFLTSDRARKIYQRKERRGLIAELREKVEDYFGKETASKIEAAYNLT